jgi:glutamate-1-semialdehyde 2,1-aminomutase
MSNIKSSQLQERAMKVIPLGANSNFRFWGVGETPFIKKGKGAYIWDMDGNKYIDYRLGFGPIILGHAYDAVDQQVAEAIKEGVCFALTSEFEVSAAEKIVAMCPSVEMVRLVNSGLEATMHALRVARAYTGREKVIKFEGMYHGFHDHLMFSTYAPAETYGSLNAPLPIPMTSGIPKGFADYVIPLPFNNEEVLEKTLRSIGYQMAAIISEPMLGNCGALDANPGFMDFIRQKCDEYGIVFILDEVKTGFRYAPGGAQELYGINPDLTAYAKAIGNGYGVAAFGGKKELMLQIGNGVAQGGTYTGNKVMAVAANAVLDIIKNEPVHETINKRGWRLMDGIKTIFDDAGIPVTLRGEPPMFSYTIGEADMYDARTWGQNDDILYLKIAKAAMDRGVMPDYDAREPWFLSYSHSEADIDETLNVMQDAVKEVKQGN